MCKLKISVISSDNVCTILRNVWQQTVVTSVIKF